MKHTSDEMLLRKMDPTIKLILEILCIPSLKSFKISIGVLKPLRRVKRKKERKKHLKCFSKSLGHGILAF